MGYSVTLTFLTWLLHISVFFLWSTSVFLLCSSSLWCHVIINLKCWINPFWLFQNVLRWVWSHWRSKTLSWEHHHISAEDWALTEADSTSRLQANQRHNITCCVQGSNNRVCFFSVSCVFCSLVWKMVMSTMEPGVLSTETRISGWRSTPSDWLASLGSSCRVATPSGGQWWRI